MIRKKAPWMLKRGTDICRWGKTSIFRVEEASVLDFSE